MPVAHGGQVLVSTTTAGLVEDEEAQLPGLTLRDLGEHRLKDLERPVRLYQLDVDGLPTRFAPLEATRPPASGRRRRGVLAASGAVVLAAGLAALAFVLRSDSPPPEVLPNSLVRFDPETLEPTDVFPIGGGADLVVVSGGYVWTTHYLLRDVGSGELRDAGDRTLTRVDPATGDAVTVGGGLAPCGLTADPSGDVWVANCYAAGGPTANVVRIDAESLDFEATWPVPAAEGFFRGLAYGGGSLWVSGVAGAGDLDYVITQLDPQTGKQRPIEIPLPGASLAWSEGYGDLWISNFTAAAVTRMHPSSGASYVVDRVGVYPAANVVEGDVAGTIGSWGGPGEREVTYWIGRAHWGKGIATCALQAFLTVDPSRPLRGRVAHDNVASRRVLEKCGFRVVATERGFAEARSLEIEELVLRLEPAQP